MTTQEFIQIYTKFDDKEEVYGWKSIEQFAQYCADYGAPSFAAVVGVETDGFTYATIDVLIGSEFDAEYENAKSYVQENLI